MGKKRFQTFNLDIIYILAQENVDWAKVEDFNIDFIRPVPPSPPPVPIDYQNPMVNI